MFISQHKKEPAVSKSSGYHASFFSPGHVIQPKLTVNEPGDQYEQEADAVADRVMRMKDSSLGESPFFQPAITAVQRKCADCEKEEQQVQRKETNQSAIAAEHELDGYVGGLTGKGQPLPRDVRSFFEPRFDHDFNNVKVHTDAAAAKSAQSIHALAYTSGNNIVFNQNQYQPEGDSGKRLLAHELTHVVQQNNSSVSPMLMRRRLKDATIGALCGGTEPFLRTPPSGFFRLDPGESQIKVTANIAWDRPNCGGRNLFLDLKRRRSVIWDADEGTKTFPIGSPTLTSDSWTGLSSGEDYYIEVRHASTNPNCCVTGPLTVDAL